VEKRNLITVL